MTQNKGKVNAKRLLKQQAKAKLQQAAALASSTPATPVLVSPTIDSDTKVCPHVRAIKLAKWRKTLPHVKWHTVPSDKAKLCLTCLALFAEEEEAESMAAHAKADADHAVAYCLGSNSFHCYGCDGTPRMVPVLTEAYTMLRKALLAQAQANRLATTPKEEKDLVLPAGLVNLGNTCFFNASMQALSHSPRLFSQQTVWSAWREREALPLTSKLAELLMEFQEATAVVNPSYFFAQLARKWKEYARYDQQDAHELLRLVMHGVQEECDTYKKKHKEDATSFLDPIFQGKMTSVIVCEVCQHVSQRNDAFLDISLPISEQGQHVSLFSCHRKKRSATLTREEQMSRKASRRRLMQERVGEPAATWLSPLVRDWVDAVVETRGERQDAALAERLQTLSREAEARHGAHLAANARLAALYALPCMQVLPLPPSTNVLHGPSATLAYWLDQFFRPEVLSDENALRCDVCWQKAHPAWHRFEQRQHEQVKKKSSGKKQLFTFATSSAEPAVHPEEEEREDEEEEEEEESKTVRGRLANLAKRIRRMSAGGDASSSCCSSLSPSRSISPRRASVDDALDALAEQTEEQLHIDKDNLDGKEKPPRPRRRALKRFLLSSLPANLVIHLKRFQQVDHFGHCVKIGSPVFLPFELDCSHWLQTAPQEQQKEEQTADMKDAKEEREESKGEDGMEEKREESNKARYKLYAVINHLGSLKGGHYTAYVRSRGGFDAPVEEEQWFHASDTHVRKASSIEVQQEGATSGYIAFYERIECTP